ncbi:MAG: hypothetical protein GF399_06410 [Candidatus Coatesbacteria bacterium]|nr:hypothetical protein [Candidatus Coatesbacteria bacterium]
MSRRPLAIILALLTLTPTLAGASALEQARRLVYEASEKLDAINLALAEAAALRAQGEHDAALDKLKLVERDVQSVQSGEERIAQAIENARENPPPFTEPGPEEDDPQVLYEEEVTNLAQIAGWQVTTAQIKQAEVHFYSAMNYFGLMSQLFDSRQSDDISVDDEAELVREKLESLRLGFNNGEQALKLAEQARQALITARELLPPDGDVLLEANLDNLQPQVDELITLIEEEKLTTRERQVRAQVELGLVLLNDRRYSQALREIERAGNFIEDHPLIDKGIAEVHYVQGREYLENDQGARAAGSFDEALSFNPDHFGANLERGKLELAAGEYARAEELLQHAAGLKPERAEPWYRLALARVGAGEAAAALTPFEKAAERGYGVDCYRDWGLALEDLGELREAAEVYEDGLGRPDGPDPVLDAHLAYIYAIRDVEDEEAVVLARRSIDNAGPLEYAWPALVLALYNDDRDGETVESAAEALTALPTDQTGARGAVRYAAAAAHYRGDDPDAALAELDQISEVPDWLVEEHRELLEDVIDELVDRAEDELDDIDDRREGLNDERADFADQLETGELDEGRTPENVQARIDEIKAELSELDGRTSELNAELEALRSRL